MRARPVPRQEVQRGMIPAGTRRRGQLGGGGGLDEGARSNGKDVRKRRRFGRAAALRTRVHQRTLLFLPMRWRFHCGPLKTVVWRWHVAVW